MRSSMSPSANSVKYLYISDLTWLGKDCLGIEYASYYIPLGQTILISHVLYEGKPDPATVDGPVENARLRLRRTYSE